MDTKNVETKKLLDNCNSIKNQIYKLELTIEELKRQLNNTEKNLFLSCKHIWILDTMEIDPCKKCFICKNCNLSKDYSFSYLNDK